MRSDRSVVGTGILTGVLLLVALGLALLATGAWRTGLRLTGIGLNLAGLSRLLLSTGLAGPLRVRHSRWSDAVVMCALGTALLVLSVVIPEQPRQPGPAD